MKKKAKKQKTYSKQVLKILNSIPNNSHIIETGSGIRISSSMDTPLLEDWRLYCSGLKSPDSFIEATFYYMISAALQRRVWLGSCEMPIFPNQYVILVGDPGVGKGLVIKPAIKCMTYHKAVRKSITPLPAADSNLIDSTELAQKYIEELRAAQGKTKFDRSYIEEDPLLFPVPAEATTFQALTHANSKAHRWFKPPVELKGKCPLIPPSGIYGHASMCFLLEELSSLFRKHSEEVVNYLIQAWDCGDYKYATKHQGVDVIRHTCLSLLAGTTPGFIRDSFNEKLINEGLSSRTLFIFEKHNRFDGYGIANLTLEQEAAKARVILRLKVLSEFFGQVDFTTEAKEYVEHFFKKVLPFEKRNTSDKLIPYYSRKDMHFSKLALAIHFANSNSMLIEKSTCITALAFMEEVEINMHLALVLGNKTPQGTATNRVLHYIDRHADKAFSMIELWKVLEGDVRDTELRDILQYLTQTNQVEEITEHGKQRFRKKKI